MQEAAQPDQVAKRSIGGALLGIIARPPLPLLRLVSRLPVMGLNESLLLVPTREPKVALTLDDGPHPDTTPSVLKTLEDHQTTATFFLHGCRAQAHGELVAAITRSGHEIGNHTWEDKPSKKLPADAFRTSLGRTHKVLTDGQGEPGREVRYFRPAGGWPSKEMVSYASLAFGYRTVIASLYPLDTRVQRDEWIVDAVARRAFPGAIIVMHEGPGRGRLSTRLEGILERLRPDYEFTTVSKLLSVA